DTVGDPFPFVVLQVPFHFLASLAVTNVLVMANQPESETVDLQVDAIIGSIAEMEPHMVPLAGVGITLALMVPVPSRRRGSLMGQGGIGGGRGEGRREDRGGRPAGR